MDRGAASTANELSKQSCQSRYTPKNPNGIDAQHATLKATPGRDSHCKAAQTPPGSVSPLDNSVELIKG